MKEKLVLNEKESEETKSGNSSERSMIFHIFPLIIIMVIAFIAIPGAGSHIVKTFKIISGSYSNIITTVNLDNTGIEYSIFLESDDDLLNNKYAYAINYNDSKKNEINNFVIDTFYIQDDNFYIRTRDNLLVEKSLLNTDYKKIIELNNSTMDFYKVTKDNKHLFSNNKNILTGSTLYTYKLHFDMDDQEKSKKLSSYLENSSYWEKVNKDIKLYEKNQSSDIDLFPYFLF